MEQSKKNYSHVVKYFNQTFDPNLEILNGYEKNSIDQIRVELNKYFWNMELCTSKYVIWFYLRWKLIDTQ